MYSAAMKHCTFHLWQRSRIFNSVDVVRQVRGSEYNQQKSQLSQIARKQTGSLAVRDLSTIVSEKDVINTENLLTLFVVVPRHVKKEWLSTYESITEYIVRASPPPPCLGLKYVNAGEFEP
jgi:hypothetical protein